MAQPDQPTSNDSSWKTDDARLLQLATSARSGDRAAFGELIEHFRPRLKHLIEIRLDRRLRKRLDASDVLQEMYVRGGVTVDRSLAFAEASPYLWLRQIAIWKLLEIQRKHFGSKRRDPRLERPEHFDQDDSKIIANWLVDSITSPSDMVAREELLRRLNDAIEGLEPIDREILVLRHCEQMSRTEAAEAIGISVAAAAKRYFRAIQRVRFALEVDTSDSAAT